MYIKKYISTAIRKINERIYLTKIRKRNMNVNPTIISNNCIGGLYHNLGLEFRSSTINLFFSQEQYLTLVKNFKYYMSCELFKNETEDSNESDK